jgi:glycosyltransferase involved in cell wall biosynthesis
MSSRSRVQFVTPLLVGEGAPGQTGGTLSNLHLLRALATRAEVRVLTLQAALDPATFAGEPFTVTHRPAPAWRGLALAARWTPHVRAVTRDLLAAHAADLVVATTSTLAALDAAIPSRRVAVVQAFENFGWRPPAGVSARTRADLAKTWLVNGCADARRVRDADAVVVTSAYMRSAVEGRFGVPAERIWLVPQVADLPTVAPVPAAAPPVVGFVNRGADKGLPFVVRLARAAPDLTFLVYGHGAVEGGDVPPNVRLAGWAADRAAMFASASVWIVPSTWPEPFGRVAMEAVCAGRAVLVSDRGGLPEAVEDAACVVRGFDVPAWVARIREALRASAPARAARAQRARARWSTERHAHATHALLDAFARSTPPARGSP